MFHSLLPPFLVIPLLPLLFVVIFCDWFKLSAVGGAADRQEGKQNIKKKR
jgi:hypothetical protein